MNAHGSFPLLSAPSNNSIKHKSAESENGPCEANSTRTVSSSPYFQNSSGKYFEHESRRVVRSHIGLILDLVVRIKGGGAWPVHRQWDGPTHPHDTLHMYDCIRMTSTEYWWSQQFGH